ncbi:tetratricopeptide repeat protein [Flexithrix dorotheae]|uniref:tetratricopeptide repeat protein n=1 Tax=Flexithrix dorotheae TaxID=70993 RepID=UPI000367ED97|nr:hypothetical protein [Flexithrix dorotheae]
MKKILNFSMLYACMVCVLWPEFALAQTEMPITVNSEEALEAYHEALQTEWDGKRTQSQEKLEMALDLDPDFFMAYLFGAMRAKNMGDMETFEEMAGKGIDLKDNLNEDEKHLCAGLELILNDKAGEASPHFEVVAATYPQDYDAVAYHAFQLYMAKEHDQSNKYFAKLLEINPERTAVYNMMGYNYMFAEQFEKAEASFDKYIETNPDHPNPYDSKGDYFMAVKDFANAVEMFNKAYEMDKENYEFSKKKADQARKMMEGN